MRTEELISLRVEDITFKGMSRGMLMVRAGNGYQEGPQQA
jgi:hypothetical protein